MRKNHKHGGVRIVSKIRRTKTVSYGDRSSWEAIRKVCFKRDGYKCTMCGATHSLTLDHIIPVSKGGTTALYNLRTLCIDCHITVTRSKGGRALLRSISKRPKSQTSKTQLKEYL